MIYVAKKTQKKCPSQNMSAKNAKTTVHHKICPSKNAKKWFKPPPGLTLADPMWAFQNMFIPLSK